MKMWDSSFAPVRPSQRAGPASQKNKDVENKKKVERRILDKIGLFVAIEKNFCRLVKGREGIG